MTPFVFSPSAEGEKELCVVVWTYLYASNPPVPSREEHAEGVHFCWDEANFLLLNLLSALNPPLLNEEGAGGGGTIYGFSCVHRSRVNTAPERKTAAATYARFR